MKNLVNIKGKILYKYHTPKGNNIILRIGCGGNAISCFTADPRLKEQLKHFDVSDDINLSGNIQSTKRGDNYTYTIFIDEIVPPELTDKFGFYNQFWLDGHVANIVDFNSCVQITVKTEQEGRISYIPVVFFHPDPRILNFEFGEKIRVQGSVQSVRKPDGNGGYVFYQNYVGSQKKIA